MMSTEKKILKMTPYAASALLKMLVGGVLSVVFFLFVVFSVKDLLVDTLQGKEQIYELADVIIALFLFFPAVWLFFIGRKQQRLNRQYNIYLQVIINESDRSLRHISKVLQLSPQRLEAQVSTLQQAGLLKEVYLDDYSDKINFTYEKQSIHTTPAYELVRCKNCEAMSQRLQHQTGQCQYCQCALPK